MRGATIGHVSGCSNWKGGVMPFRLGPLELIIILVIVMVIFGVGRLPEIGGAIGKAIREFRSSQSADADTGSTTQSEAVTSGKQNGSA